MDDVSLISVFGILMLASRSSIDCAAFCARSLG